MRDKDSAYKENMCRIETNTQETDTGKVMSHWPWQIHSSLPPVGFNLGDRAPNAHSHIELTKSVPSEFLEFK